MVICRKVESPESAGGRNGHNGHDHRKTSAFEGGPVFVPPRPPSPFAQALLAKSAEGEANGSGDFPPRSLLGDGVTPYDELWYLGRPRVS